MQGYKYALGQQAAAKAAYAKTVKAAHDDKKEHQGEKKQQEQAKEQAAEEHADQKQKQEVWAKKAAQKHDYEKAQKIAYEQQVCSAAGRENQLRSTCMDSVIHGQPLVSLK